MSAKSKNQKNIKPRHVYPTCGEARSLPVLGETYFLWQEDLCTRSHKSDEEDGMMSAMPPFSECPAPPPPYTRLIKIVEEPPCRQFFVPFRWTRNSAAFFLGDTQKTHNKKQKMNEESLAATQKSDETRTSFTAAGSFRLLSRHWNRVCRRMQQDRFVPNGNFEMCGMQNMITASIHHHSPSKFACQKNHAQTKMPTLRSHRS